MRQKMGRKMISVSAGGASLHDPDSLDAISPPRSLWARLAPPALTLIIFLLIFWRIPFGRFWEALSGARLLPFLALMGSFSLCFFLMDTFVLSRVIRWFHGPLAYRELLPVRAVTYIVSIVNTQLAQAALAIYIYRRFRTPLGQITSTVALLILLEVTQLTLFATAGILSFPGQAPLGLLAAPLALGAAWWIVKGLALGRFGALGRRLAGNVLLSTFRRVGLGHCAAVLGLKGSVFLLSLFVHSQALGFFGVVGLEGAEDVDAVEGHGVLLVGVEKVCFLPKKRSRIVPPSPIRFFATINSASPPSRIASSVVFGTSCSSGR